MTADGWAALRLALRPLSNSRTSVSVVAPEFTVADLAEVVDRRFLEDLVVVLVEWLQAVRT